MAIPRFPKLPSNMLPEFMFFLSLFMMLMSWPYHTNPVYKYDEINGQEIDHGVYRIGELKTQNKHKWKVYIEQTWACRSFKLADTWNLLHGVYSSGQLSHFSKVDIWVWFGSKLVVNWPRKWDVLDFWKTSTIFPIILQKSITM